MPKHHHPSHHRGHRPPHGLAGRGASRQSISLLQAYDDAASELLGETRLVSSDETLRALLPSSFATELQRAASEGPYEVRALFLLGVVRLQHQIAKCEEAGVLIEPFDPQDLVNGMETHSALAMLMNQSQHKRCVDDAMSGPLEIQAVAIVSLLSLRLAAASHSINTEGEADV